MKIMRDSARAQRSIQRSHRQAQLRYIREAERERRAVERAQIADEKERKRQYLESRIQETAQLNEDLDNENKLLANTLLDYLATPFTFNIDTIVKKPDISPFEPGNLAIAEKEPDRSKYLPSEHSFMKSLGPFKKRYEQKLSEGEKAYELELGAFKGREATRESKLNEAKTSYEQETKRILQENLTQLLQIHSIKEGLGQADPNSIIGYISLMFDSWDHPEGFPSKAKFGYIPESKQLIMEYDLPTYDIVPDTASYKFVKSLDKIIANPARESYRKSLYASVIAQDVLRVIHLIYSADQQGNIDSLVVNGHVAAVDKGTGKNVRPCIITIRTTRDTFDGVNLEKVDPMACLKSLNASFSRSPSELAPVKPVLEFSMVDPRFIEESDILDNLDEKPNIMDLTPGEFESLISNLFEKMGLETRLTQPSRDGGVDCVAYDTRPIFGGKVIIQAKRYKDTVGVSAVRDLFGTVLNEGASKGILVSTSGYGKAAFDFAEGKPLELLSGTNLLYLLEKYAGIHAVIELPSV